MYLLIKLTTLEDVSASKETVRFTYNNLEILRIVFFKKEVYM